MRVLVSGSSGLVGRAVCNALGEAGHTVVCLVRSNTTLSEHAIYWDPDRGVLAGDQISGMDAVVHLAGESIASGRWTPARKERIRESRVKGTRLLCERLVSCGRPPAVLLSASALGIYGDRGDEEITEESPPGEGFLAGVCETWEAETARAAAAGIRTVNLRIGMVLSGQGGALAKMLPAFKLGLGGPLGNGRMWMSWIHLNDLVRTILYCLDNESMSGPVNAFSPNPVTNRDFSRTLGGVLGRPAIFTVPAPVLRLALGEMADELLLSSLRGYPRRLESAGFTFNYPELESALAELLGR